MIVYHQFITLIVTKYTTKYTGYKSVFRNDKNNGSQKGHVIRVLYKEFDREDYAIACYYDNFRYFQKIFCKTQNL